MIDDEARKLMENAQRLLLKSADEIKALQRDLMEANLRTVRRSVLHQYAEEQRDAALKRLAEIHDKATDVCARFHSNDDAPAARYAYALALAGIAELAATASTEGEKR
jgi:hypothetical protein